MKYPFIPKSTAHLEPGQYWSIPISNGRFACGVVLQLRFIDGKRDSRNFLASLLNWNGDSEPNDKSIAGAKILDHGHVHIKAITKNQGVMLGAKTLEQHEFEIPLTFDQSPGLRCQLRRGFELLGIASIEQQKQLRVFSTWGYGVIKNLAEKHSGNAI
jgi:hypothetical protein